MATENGSMNLVEALDLSIDALNERIWYVRRFKRARGEDAAHTEARRAKRIDEFEGAQGVLRALRDLIETQA
jgi:hypothetical protein